MNIIPIVDGLVGNIEKNKEIGNKCFGCYFHKYSEVFYIADQKSQTKVNNSCPLITEFSETKVIL